MAKHLKITGRVQHARMVDGNKERIVFSAGDIVTPDDDYGLTEADIDRIVRGNCGVLIDPEAEATDEAEDDDEAELRQIQLVEAIEELEQGNDAHWTKGNLPEITALEKISGLTKVSATERDAAWAAFNEE